MQLQAILAIFALSTSAFAKDCNAGAFSNECVSFFSDSSCSTYEGSYTPTCGGNCYQYPFKGIIAQGNGIYGTDCTAYYDSNCQQPFGDTGNQVGTGGCTDFSAGGGANSMKCYFDC